MNHLVARAGIVVAAWSLFAAAAAAQGHPFDASRAVVSSPAKLADFSSAQLKGFPVLLSWAPDGGQLSLGVVQRDRWANEKSWFFAVTLDKPLLAPVDRQPDWAGPYWMWKSDLRCPGAPQWRIEVETRVERFSATNAGSGGDLGQNGGDPYGAGFLLGPQGQAIIKGAMQSQQVSTTTMKLKRTLLAEFVNTPAIPGLMYSWAPLGLEAIAYAGDKRALTLMDRSGRRHEVPGTKSVLLPAWSPDGKRVAWVEQRGRGKFVLMVADVAMR